MNTQDRDMLVSAWIKETDSAEGVIQDSIKRAQDHAYSVGIERGKQNISKTVAVVEQTIKAIDAYMIGTGTERERLNSIEEAYAELEKLLDELSC